MKKHLVLVGGGHAHLTVLKFLNRFMEDGHAVTLISPAPYHYYSGMGPGLLSGIYRPRDVRFHVRRMAVDQGAAFVPGSVTRVEPEFRRLYTETGDRIDYDIVSFNTGSRVPVDRVSESAGNVYPVKPIENLVKAKEAVEARIDNPDLRLAVVGGGPAGLELAGNLRQLVDSHKGSARISLFAGKRLLGRVPDKVRQHAYQALSDRQVAVVEGDWVDNILDGSLVTLSGKKYPYDIMLLAWGIRPHPLFAEAGIPTDGDGGLLVNTYLQSVSYPELFGGGDCIGYQERPLDKVGVYPVRENPILFHNLLAALNGTDLKPFHPQEDYLLIFNVGNRKGVYWKKERVLKGWLAFLFKDYIDRSFMKKFQISDERSETA